MKMAHQSHFAPRELALLHAAHHNDCGEEAPKIPEEQADGTLAIYRHHTIAVKRGPPKMALIGIKIADEYDVPMWMSLKIFLDRDRKSTRLNSSHTVISYAVFCLKKKKIKKTQR